MISYFSVSVFAVFLGLSLPAAEGVAPDWLIWVMVGFTAFHVIVDIILEVHKCTAQKSKGWYCVLSFAAALLWQSSHF